MSEISKSIQIICDEKGLDYDTVLEAVQTALGAAYRKDFGTRQGNYKVAIEAADKARALATRGSHGLPGRQKQVAAPWLVDKIFGQWDKILATDPEYQGAPYLDGIWAYALGGAYIGKGDLGKAEQQLETLQQLVNAPNADEYRVGATPVRDVLRTAALALEGEVLEAKGDLNGAIASYQAAVDIEDQNNYTEPPDWPQPIRHYLGAALLEAGRAEEAEQVYLRDLRWNQNNGWSLYGLHQALLAQGKNADAEQVKAQYESAWRFAGMDLTRSRL